MEAFLKSVAENLLSIQGEKLRHTVIVFNNKRPVAYMQQHLARLIGKPFWSPSFLTVQELFAQSSSQLVADQYMQFFTLYEVYEKLIAAEGGQTSSPDSFYSMGQTILSDFAQIDTELVSHAEVFTELADIAEIQQQFQHLTPEQQQFLSGFWSSFSAGKQQAQQEQFVRMWRRMSKLYEGFHQQLEERGLTTMGQLYRGLADGSADRADFIGQYDKIVLVGFNALSTAEATVFKRWQSEGKALFYFDTDQYYLNDPLQEAGFFLRKNLEQHHLVNALGAPPELIRSNKKTINVYKTRGKAAQAKLLDSLLPEQYPLLKQVDHTGRIAVVLADEDLLVPVLQTIPGDFPGERVPLPVNVTMGFPLTASGIFGLAELWLAIQEKFILGQHETVYHRDAEAFLSHPLTQVTEQERKAIQQQILDAQLVDVPRSLLQTSGELAQLFFEPLAGGVKGIGNLYAVFEYILFAQVNNNEVLKLSGSLLNAVLKELNRLQDVLSVFAARLPSALLLSLMRKAMHAISVPLLGEPLQGLQVMGLLESRSLDFQHVYLLGACEGMLPKTNRGQSFIPDSIRRAFGLPVPENQDAVSAYMFYRLLQRSETFHIIYDAQGDETSPGEPSRFIRQMAFESGYQFQYFDQVQDLALQPRVLFNVPKTGAVLQELNNYFSDAHSAPKLFSATALTTYMNCPMQFYYRYIARIKEPEELAENLEANSIGSILHLVMEKFYQRLKSDTSLITVERIKAERHMLPDLCQSAFREILFNNESKAVPESLNGMQQVVIAIIEKYATIILNHDEQLAPFTLIELENKDDYQVDLPIVVDGEPRTIRLFGIIDRVDEKNGITRIVDYKTGSDKLGYSCVDDLFQTDSKQANKALVQTLFYTYIYERVKGLTGVEPNLYVIKNIRKEGTLFVEGSGKNKTLLQAEPLVECKANFETRLVEKFEELFNPNISFFQTTQEKNCSYCPYLTICGK